MIEPLWPSGRIRLVPVLKWAGGKSQLLRELLPLVPNSYKKYIEPFVGGGALFFALLPKNAILSDSNPELINFYVVLRDNVESLIERAAAWDTDEKTYYKIRGLNAVSLSTVDRAARSLYLNRTCFNGLYRVNARGDFNVPYGRYSSPRIVDPKSLREASRALSGTCLVCDDYRTVLRRYASAGDFVFLDPPYVPVGRYADFKRYTKDQFREDDHRQVAEEVGLLRRLGCNVLITNSNHPLVLALYSQYDVRTVQTRRNISSNGAGRLGEDLIIRVVP